MDSDSSDNSRDSTHFDGDSDASSAEDGVYSSAKRYFNLQKCSTKTFLSPITEISLGLEDTNLCTTPVKTSEYLKIEPFGGFPQFFVFLRTHSDRTAVRLCGPYVFGREKWEVPLVGNVE
jgi:hypothetical protein